VASITKLEQELAQADRHIVDARARMALQLNVMRRLEADGRDAAQAKSLYRDIEDGLERMLAHRERIVRELSKAPG
jgi:hypothetical protein